MINEVNSNTSQSSSSSSGKSTAKSVGSNTLSTLVNDVIQANLEKADAAASSLAKLVSSGSLDATSQTVQIIQSQVTQTSISKEALEKLLSALLNAQRNSQIPAAIQSDIKTVFNNADKSTVLRSIIQNLLEFSPSEPVDETAALKPVFQSTQETGRSLAEISKLLDDLNIIFNPSKSSVTTSVYTNLMPSRESVELFVSNFFRDVQVNLYFDRALAQFYGGKRVGLIMGILQVGNLSPMLYISPLVYDLLVKMGTLKDKRNIFKTAFVTESVGSLSSIDQAKNVHLMPSSSSMNEQQYNSAFQDLFDTGFLRIISLHLHPLFSSGLRAAQEASKNFDKKIIIENLDTNGLGLGLVINQLNQLIKQNYSPEDLLELIHQCQKATKYWSIPLDFNFQLHSHWLDKLIEPRDKFKLRVLKQVPLFELDKEFKLIGTFASPETAFQFLTQKLGQHVKKAGHIHKIGIEYRTAYRYALNCQNKLRVKFKKVAHKPYIAGSNTTQYMGPKFIGVCVV